jgi:hypothetical protein
MPQTKRTAVSKGREYNTEVPPGMKVQLARLFGSSSSEARTEGRSVTQWKRTLRATLRELDRYLDANVETDEIHSRMLYSGLAAAKESLKGENFWPGYAEGLTRLALVLMGDYPDHRKRKGGRKQENHYDLSRQRSVRYAQTSEQKLKTLIAAPPLGIKLSVDPWDALREFRNQFGNRVGYKQFFIWYRRTYPQDYAAIF